MSWWPLNEGKDIFLTRNVERVDSREEVKYEWEFTEQIDGEMNKAAMSQKSWCNEPLCRNVEGDLSEIPS